MCTQEKGENQHMQDKMLCSKLRVWILKQCRGTITHLLKDHKSMIIAKNKWQSVGFGEDTIRAASSVNCFSPFGE